MKNTYTLVERNALSPRINTVNNYYHDKLKNISRNNTHRRILSNTNNTFNNVNINQCLSPMRSYCVNSTQSTIQTYQCVSNDNNNKDGKDVSYYKEELSKLNEIVNLLRSQNESIIKQRDSAIKQLNDIKDINNSSLEEKRLLENEISHLQKQNDALNQQVIFLSNENESLRNDLNNMSEELQLKTNELYNLQEQSENAIAELHEQLNQLQQELETKTREFNEKQKQLQLMNQSLNGKIKELQRELVDNKTKLHKLEEESKNGSKRDKAIDDILSVLWNFHNECASILDSKYKKELLNEMKLSLKDNKPENVIKEFKQKIDVIINNIKSIHEGYFAKFGKCFACDIGSCSSHNKRIKIFQHKYK
jgi:chromosome segregation ATPase